MGIDPAYGSSAFGTYNDIFDAFRLALKFYHFRDSSSEW
jgi:hypothetical protein